MYIYRGLSSHNSPYDTDRSAEDGDWPKQVRTNKLSARDDRPCIIRKCDQLNIVEGVNDVAEGAYFLICWDQRSDRLTTTPGRNWFGSTNLERVTTERQLLQTNRPVKAFSYLGIGPFPSYLGSEVLDWKVRGGGVAIALCLTHVTNTITMAMVVSWYLPLALAVFGGSALAAVPFLYVCLPSKKVETPPPEGEPAQEEVFVITRM
ncbi:hypothetical protein AAG570_012181 [Ranatra chinensis]|uniref:Uncharacterized protein n=1 Tax=Ranatra chinensis TaxID=642074 RepID=A0ABD0YI23_9HEMI